MLDQTAERHINRSASAKVEKILGCKRPASPFSADALDDLVCNRYHFQLRVLENIIDISNKQRRKFQDSNLFIGCFLEKKIKSPYQKLATFNSLVERLFDLRASRSSRKTKNSDALPPYCILSAGDEPVFWSI
jgi:hypothetical protein